VPGDFSKSNRPRLPGAFFRFDARQSVTPPPGLGGIVAVAFTCDWGPLRTPTLLRSFQDFRAAFGDSVDSQGYRAVRQAFQGEGLPGYGGAGAVLAYRLGAAAAAKASHALANTTPAPTAITLTAAYEGVRGNDLNVTVQDHAGDATKTDLIVYDGATEVERYVFLDTAVNDLAAQINDRSDWLTAVAAITGVALTTVANVSLTGGADGSTLIAGDYTAMMSGLEVERFAVLSFEMPDDAGILASLRAWVVNARENGKMFRVVVGGVLDETADDAIDRSGVLDDPGFVNIGVGSVEDDVLGVLSTAMLAPRVAGIVAARGEARSLTYARFAGLTLLSGPTDADILRCYDGGVATLARDSNLDAPVRIAKGVNTYTDTDDPDKPLAIFRDPKFVATMDGLQMEVTEFGEQEVIGKMPVSATTRSFCRAQISRRMQTREDAGIIQPGWTVDVDLDPPPTAQDDFLGFIIGLTFGRSTEQIYISASVG
jgi:hypothetical protein